MSGVGKGRAIMTWGVEGTGKRGVNNMRKKEIRGGLYMREGMMRVEYGCEEWRLRGESEKGKAKRDQSVT